MIGATDAPFKNVPELLAYASANPGKINFGVPNGAPPHMLAEMFKMQTGTDILVVPYRGASTLITDMLAGRIHGGFETTSVMFAHLHDGHIRGLAVLRDSRIPAAPGRADHDRKRRRTASWALRGRLVAPAGRRKHLAGSAPDIARGAAVAGVRGQAPSMSPPRHADMSAAEFGDFIAAEYQRIGAIMTARRKSKLKSGRFAAPGAGGYSLGPFSSSRATRSSHEAAHFPLVGSLSPAVIRLAQNAPTRQELAVYAGLHEAAAKGDVAEIEKLIKDGEKAEHPGLQEPHAAACRGLHEAARGGEGAAGAAAPIRTRWRSTATISSPSPRSRTTSRC